jgi:hypothetical protein
MTEPFRLGYADFADRIGADFALRLPDGDHAPLVLTDCTAAGPGTFSLTFKAGPGAPIYQASYQLSADGFGPELIFLVPVAHRPDDPEFPLEYQAIFNSSSTHRLEEEAR